MITSVERREQTKKIIRDICSKCTKKAGMGLEDPCWSCAWKWLIDEILGNGK